MPGIPHLSGIQAFNNDLFRTGTSESAAQQGNAAANPKAQANAVQAPPETGRGQRGADPDGDDADVRRERARIEAENRPEIDVNLESSDVVRLGDRRLGAREAQADLFAQPLRRFAGAVAAAAQPAAEDDTAAESAPTDRARLARAQAAFAPKTSAPPPRLEDVSA